MKNLKSNFKILSFYRFVKIKNKVAIKKKLDVYLKEKFLKGTILISDEGINGSISGIEDDVFETLILVKKLVSIKKISLNINEINFLPFNQMKVRLKNEIVSLGIKNLEVKSHYKYANFDEWNKLITDKKTKIIDVRNEYEIDIGKFKNSINPKTKNFREFPNEFKKMDIKKSDKIAMYCTGGIRCEKASALLKSNGFKNIIQLKGGIVNYLKACKENNIKSKWDGECFVFDNRVTINNNLKKGRYTQCFGCRRPLTKKDTLSINYKKGVHCSYCINLRSSEQKKKSYNRQRYIEWLDLNKIKHNFRSIGFDEQVNLKK